MDRGGPSPACEHRNASTRLSAAFPDLKDVLVNQSRIDQDALGKSLEALSSGYRSFREAVAHASKHLDERMVVNSDGSLSKMSGDDFAKWLDEQMSGLLERLANLNPLCPLLKPRCDVHLGDLPVRLASIAALQEAILGSCRSSMALMEDGGLDLRDRAKLRSVRRRIRTPRGRRVGPGADHRRAAASEQFDPLVGAFPELKAVIVDQVAG